MALLEISRLSAAYGMARALESISLEIGEGAMAAVIGANGAGKTTLMDSIVGWVRPQGEVRLAGRDLVGLGSAEIARAGIGYAPERGHLFPYLSVRDNLMVGAFTARADSARNLELVHDLFPVLRERADQETATLSGGERQMVSVGRALMTSPRILLVDEPTIGLAPKVCDEMAAALARLNRETGLTILIAEQNVNFALKLAGEIHVLETGRIRMSGDAQRLRADPAVAKAYFGE